jgi:hypothetical protein
MSANDHFGMNMAEGAFLPQFGKFQCGADADFNQSESPIFV